MPKTPGDNSLRSPLRKAVLDAVRVLLVDRGWSRTTVSDVATAAGVTRAEVYEEFGTRRGLAEAYVIRDVTRMLNAMEAAIRTNPEDPLRAMRIALEIFLRLASDEPVIQIIVAGVDEGGLLGLLTSLGRAIASERLAQVMVEVWPDLPRADIGVFADATVRLAISHAVMPTDDAPTVAGDISRLLNPFLERAIQNQPSDRRLVPAPPVELAGT